MDNASKALIMIGGVLITVMVISLSMYIFSGARGIASASEQGIATAQTQAFNRFFEAYPSQIKGLDVYNIIGKIEDIKADVSALENISYSGATKASVEKTVNFMDLYYYSYSDTDGDGLIDFVQFSKS